MSDFEQALAILTRQATRLVQSASHIVPGQAKTMLAVLELHAMHLTDARLLSIEQLDAFFQVTHTVTGSNILEAVLTEPSVAREQAVYIERRCATAQA